MSRERLNGQTGPKSPRKLTKREFEFAAEGLGEMNRLLAEADQLSRRRDELEPRFKQACMQKAWVILIAYLTGCLILLFSFFWGGLSLILFRVGLVSGLVALYYLPVHWFVGGSLRSDARLVRQLDRKRIAFAREAAKIGVSMNGEFRTKPGLGRRRFTR